MGYNYSTVIPEVTPVIGQAGGAAQSNAASLAAKAGFLNYVTGFDITGGGATAASIIEAVLSGLLGGSLKYELNILAGATGPMTTAGNVFSVKFDPPLPASAPNVAITMTCPSLGAGNTNANVNIYGFQRQV